MKITLLSFLFTLISLNVSAQNGDKKLDSASIERKILGRNELKTNLWMLASLNVVELNYERLLSNSGFGVSASIDVGNIGFNFSIISYYRLYFGKNEAAGFFIEGNAVFYNAEKSRSWRYLEDGTYFELSRLIENQYGLGAAVGGKFLNRKGFVGEIFGGVARVFGGNDDYFPRLGITLGKRF